MSEPTPLEIDYRHQIAQLTKERDQLAAKVALLEVALSNATADKPVSTWTTSSVECGEGWLSPDKKKELEDLHSHALLRIAKLVSREKVLVEALELISKSLDSEARFNAKQALEACKI